MDEATREKIALFRYGLIAPLLHDQVDRETYLAQQSAKIHEVPHYGKKRYAPKTILEWHLLYRRHGFDGLKPGSVLTGASCAPCRRTSRTTSWRSEKKSSRCPLPSSMTN